MLVFTDRVRNFVIQRDSRVKPTLLEISLLGWFRHQTRKDMSKTPSFGHVLPEEP